MNWRPIETAPKGYTKVLAYDPQICHHIVAYQDDDGVWLNDWKNGEFYPTHWMPLPPAPSSEPAPQDTGEKWEVHDEGDRYALCKVDNSMARFPVSFDHEHEAEYVYEYINNLLASLNV